MKNEKIMQLCKKVSLIVAAIILVTLTSCSGDGGEVESKRFVQEGKKLTVYTSHKEEVYGPIIKEFEERTGIWIEVKTGGTMEFLELLALEEGHETCDIMFGGGVESYEAHKSYFEPYLCGESDMLDETFQSEEGVWTVFSELPIVFVYNKKLVTKTEAPTGWNDLLGSEWKGKIAFADPNNSGVSCTTLLTLCQIYDKEPEEVVQIFADELEGDFSESSKAIISEVTSGTKLIGITLEETAMKAIKQGADISMVYPEEGTSVVPDGVAIVKGAPHLENAKLFIDFVVGKDVQKLLGDQMCRRTVRTDIENSNEWKEIKVIDFDLKWASKNQAEILGIWNEIIEQESQK